MGGFENGIIRESDNRTVGVVGEVGIGYGDSEFGIGARDKRGHVFELTFGFVN